jgi:aminoglycoside phosphotransferase (APT) family kinase protein
MGVQDEFKEDNFMRVTRRTNTARVLAHVLAPQLNAILGRSSGTPQVEAIDGQGWSNFTLKVSFKNEPRDFILRLSEKAPTAEARLCRSVLHLEKEYAILSQLQGFSFVPKLLSGGIGSIVLDIPGKGLKEYGFMMEEMIPYKSASECRTLNDRLPYILEQLGEVCREIHKISVPGYGIDFNAAQGSFSHSTFEGFVRSKIDTIRHSPISFAMMRWLEARAEELIKIDPEPKLFHRDLLGNTGNYLVDNEHNVRSIIDWEFAGSGAAFQYEVASMVYVLARDGHSAERIERDLHAVLRGYGMSLAEYRNNYERDVETVVLMNSISAMIKFAELKKRDAVAQEPWRKVFAERAESVCARSFARDRVGVG